MDKWTVIFAALISAAVSVPVTLVLAGRHTRAMPTIVFAPRSMKRLPTISVAEDEAQRANLAGCYQGH